MLCMIMHNLAWLCTSVADGTGRLIMQNLPGLCTSVADGTGKLIMHNLTWLCTSVADGTGRLVRGWVGEWENWRPSRPLPPPPPPTLHHPHAHSSPHLSTPPPSPPPYQAPVLPTDFFKDEKAMLNRLIDLHARVLSLFSIIDSEF